MFDRQQTANCKMPQQSLWKITRATEYWVFVKHFFDWRRKCQTWLAGTWVSEKKCQRGDGNKSNKHEIKAFLCVNTTQVHYSLKKIMWLMGWYLFRGWETLAVFPIMLGTTGIWADCLSKTPLNDIMFLPFCLEQSSLLALYPNKFCAAVAAALL